MIVVVSITVAVIIVRMFCLHLIFVFFGFSASFLYTERRVAVQVARSAGYLTF